MKVFEICKMWNAFDENPVDNDTFDYAAFESVNMWFHDFGTKSAGDNKRHLTSKRAFKYFFKGLPSSVGAEMFRAIRGTEKIPISHCSYNFNDIIDEMNGNLPMHLASSCPLNCDKYGNPTMPLRLSANVDMMDAEYIMDWIMVIMSLRSKRTLMESSGQSRL